MLGPFDKGTDITVFVLFTDTNNNPADPGAVTCTVFTPDGATLTPTVPAKDSVGNYHAVITAALQVGHIGGVWKFKFAGTTPLIVVGDSSFYLNDPGF